MYGKADFTRANYKSCSVLDYVFTRGIESEMEESMTLKVQRYTSDLDLSDHAILYLYWNM